MYSGIYSMPSLEAHAVIVVIVGVAALERRLNGRVLIGRGRHWGQAIVQVVVVRRRGERMQ